MGAGRNNKHNIIPSYRTHFDYETAEHFLNTKKAVIGGCAPNDCLSYQDYIYHYLKTSY